MQFRQGKVTKTKKKKHLWAVVACYGHKSPWMDNAHPKMHVDNSFRQWVVDYINGALRLGFHFWRLD